jgi:hypothetical protein
MINRKNANSGHQPTPPPAIPVEPGDAKSAQDAIQVLKSQQKGENSDNSAGCFTPSQKTTRTPQQSTTLPNPHAIEGAYKLLSTQRTRGAPEKCRDEVLDDLKHIHSDLKAIAAKAQSQAQPNTATVHATRPRQRQTRKNLGPSGTDWSRHRPKQATKH